MYVRRSMKSQRASLFLSLSPLLSLVSPSSLEPSSLPSLPSLPPTSPFSPPSTSINSGRRSLWTPNWQLPAAASSMYQRIICRDCLHVRGDVHMQCSCSTSTL